MEKNSLETDNTMTPEQILKLTEQRHVVRSEEVVCDLVNGSNADNEESSKKMVGLGTKVDLCKIEGTRASKKADIEIKEIDDTVGKIKSKVEHEKKESQVDDGAKGSADPAVQELELKLKLVGKDMDRKISEITQLRKRLRELEEEKDEINNDLNEILNLNAGDRDRSILELKQKVREVEKEKKQLSKALKEAIFAQQETKEEQRNLKEGNCKQSHNRHNYSLQEIMNEIKTEANEGGGWSGKHDILCNTIVKQ